MEPEVKAIEEALDAVNRQSLPDWFADVLTVLARNIELFPPLDEEDREIPGHIYPH